jgi:hypothetical protein
VFELESSNARRVKNSNRRILAYLRIWILSNNAAVGLYRQTLISNYHFKRKIMKILYILFSVLIVFNHTNSFSQDNTMNKEVEEITKLGKDSIVKLALNLIDEKVPMENFTKIVVMASGEEIYVSFNMNIIYLPMNSVFYTSVDVRIIEKYAHYSTTSNPIDYKYDQKNIPFYKETEEARINIQFIIDAINKSNEIGSFERTNFEDYMQIREKDDYYDISVGSEFQASWYKIEKVTGRIYDSGHEHSEPPPVMEDDDLFIEIK